MLTSGNTLLFRAVCTRHSLRPLNLRFRHNNASSSGDKQPATPWHRRWLEKFSLYAMSPSSTAAFDPIVVNSAYKTDKVDTSKWSLAYYDFDASRIGYVAVGSIAAISISSGIACFDYLSNGKFTLSPILRLMDDATELGPLTVVPITLMFIVSGVLLRLHSMRVFRIYQSFEDPDKFFAIFPGFFRMYRRLDLTRSEILVLDELYESDSFHNLLFSGNTKLGSSPVLLNIDAFKTPLHKSYFLNESDTLPQEFHKAESPSRSSRASRRPPSRSGSDVPPAPPPF